MLCPKCGRPDFCLVRNDGKTCICARVESGKPYGQAGWLHYLPADEVQAVKRPTAEKEYLTPRAVQAFLDSIRTDRNEAMIERQAGQLGLYALDLNLMQCHYDSDKAALVFPMFDAAHQPIGARFRRADGRKWSLRGGREGIFRPLILFRSIPLFIAEGPTDAAALCHVGLDNTIGRPSCMSGGPIIQELLVPDKIQPVIIVADPDDPGVNGATRLANQLPNPVVVVTGPTDVREFVVEFGLPSVCRRAIIESLENESDDQTEWRAIYHNESGKFFPFKRKFK